MWQKIVGNHPERIWGILGTLTLISFLGLSPASQRPNISETNSPEMKRIYTADQADREGSIAAITQQTQQQRLEWGNKIGPRDAQRRKQVMDLISRSALHTGQDFDEAATVFQHGDTSDDILFAHALAVIAIAKGNAGSRQTAAETLDRYLQRIKQPQIYGTQFTVGPDNKTSQEPYNRSLVPESLRAVMCVPDQASQQQMITLMNQGKEPPADSTGCQ